MLLEYLMANNLPFAHVERPSLAKLLSYVSRCETDELPSETRHSMRAALDEVYRYSLEKVKSRPAAHKGRFALTLDEWKSSNNRNSLAVSLHFHSVNLELQKFVIGSEVFNNVLSYTGKVFYGHLNRVLNGYDIKDRIISNTKEFSAPINTLIDDFKESFNKNDTESEFTGDIRCAGHVLNLTTYAFLASTYFKASKSKILLKSLEPTRESFPNFEVTNSCMEDIPKIVSSIIKGARNNNTLKNQFKKLVKDQKTNEIKKRASKLFFNVTRLGGF